MHDLLRAHDLARGRDQFKMGSPDAYGRHAFNVGARAPAGHCVAASPAALEALVSAQG